LCGACNGATLPIIMVDLAAEYERAARFRVDLARYLELPAGTDPQGVGITLGPSDELVIGMPLATAEALLRDAARAEVRVPALR